MHDPELKQILNKRTGLRWLVGEYKATAVAHETTYTIERGHGGGWSLYKTVAGGAKILMRHGTLAVVAGGVLEEHGANHH